MAVQNRLRRNAFALHNPAVHHVPRVLGVGANHVIGMPPNPKLEFVLQRSDLGPPVGHGLNPGVLQLPVVGALVDPDSCVGGRVLTAENAQSRRGPRIQFVF